MMPIIGKGILLIGGSGGEYIGEFAGNSSYTVAEQGKYYLFGVSTLIRNTSSETTLLNYANFTVLVNSVAVTETNDATSVGSITPSGNQFRGGGHAKLYALTLNAGDVLTVTGSYPQVVRLYLVKAGTLRTADEFNSGTGYDPSKKGQYFVFTSAWGTSYGNSGASNARARAAHDITVNGATETYLATDTVTSSASGGGYTCYTAAISRVYSVDLATGDSVVITQNGNRTTNHAYIVRT